MTTKKQKKINPNLIVECRAVKYAFDNSLSLLTDIQEQEAVNMDTLRLHAENLQQLSLQLDDVFNKMVAKLEIEGGVKIIPIPPRKKQKKPLTRG